MRTKQPELIVCLRCNLQWTGEDMCHCHRCKKLYDSLDQFDAHLKQCHG